MNIEDQLQRQININMQLRRQLETARRDAVEYCAKYCEDHEAGMMYGNGKGWSLNPRSGTSGTHSGDAYAAGLRGIIGK